MDYDILANISLNFTFDSNDGGIQPEESMSMIFHEIIFSIICLVGIIADGIIIYIINRFKNMKTPTNIYIMNWLVSDAVYFLITPCFYRIFSALENLFIGEEIVCIAFELASILQITSILFIMILCINWFLAVFTVRFGQFYKYIIIMVWLAALSGMISLTTFCANRQYSLISHFLLFFGYAILMCLVIAMLVTRHYTKQFVEIHDKLKFNLVIVNAYVICWFPSWLCLLVGSFVDSHFGLYYYSIFAACLGYLNPLVNVYIFAKMNKNFRMALMQVFRCINPDYNDATHSFDESDDYTNNFNDVQVTSLSENITV